ncbi:MAG: COG4315 family predicted lipoprotein [Acidimicrobiia bacterium]
MRIGTLAGLTLAGAAALAACGSGTGSSPTAASKAPATPARSTAAVAVRATSLGDVLVDAQGRTLYAFTNDMNGTSTCTGGCAQNWPPLTVTGGWQVGSGLDRATFHTAGTGSQAQLVAGRWPLYRFAGDSRPGDVNGQGSLGKWFVVRSDGSLMTSTSAASSTSTSGTPAASGSGY